MARPKKAPVNEESSPITIDDLVTQGAQRVRNVQTRIDNLSDEEWIKARLENLALLRVKEEQTQAILLAAQQAGVKPAEQQRLAFDEELQSSTSLRLVASIPKSPAPPIEGAMPPDPLEEDMQPAGVDHNGKQADPHAAKRGRLRSALAGV